MLITSVCSLFLILLNSTPTLHSERFFSSVLTLFHVYIFANIELKIVILNSFFSLYRQGLPSHPLRTGPLGASFAGSRDLLLVYAPSASLYLHSICTSLFFEFLRKGSAPHNPLRVIPLEDSLAGVGDSFFFNSKNKIPSFINFPNFGDIAPPPSDQIWTSRHHASVREPFSLDLESVFNTKQGTPPIFKICVNYFTRLSTTGFKPHWSPQLGLFFYPPDTGFYPSSLYFYPDFI